ncbi:hypothetical protein C0J52_28243 [Blattella germanica]|nr:hypothetical protein C0J52_28243 [Blattella germanica]
MSLRSGSYNTPWETVIITDTRKRTPSRLQEGEFTLPGPAYTGILPISLLKWKDLKELSKLLTKKESKMFYDNIPHCE